MEPAERQMQFVFTLRSRGVTNAAVLRAMENTPRTEFLEGIFQERSFEDVPLPINCGQTISQPTVVGIDTATQEVVETIMIDGLDQINGLFVGDVEELRKTLGS